ncbi:MAG: deoxyribonuclease IV [Phycisphaerae bacterium]|nr:deoxyribonuclease IV [Phycisphaerae bacterium]
MFGSHLSIAGSMANALREAESLGMDTVQVFTKNQQQWKVKPLERAAVDEWLAELRRLKWEDRTVSHASYLINLASPDDVLRRRSIELMREEIERAEMLSIPLVVVHPGAFTTSTAAEGVSRAAASVAEVLRSTPRYRTAVCLENTAGGGTLLGGAFEDLAAIRSRAVEAGGQPDRIGFCFDTCHAHAAGHDMGSRNAAAATLESFDAVCGLKRLRVLHLNDSKAPFGSHVDRHAHIGEGTIGRGGFAAVVNHPLFRALPKILETPKETTPKGTPWDRVNLQRLKRAGRPAIPRRPR